MTNLVNDFNKYIKESEEVLKKVEEVGESFIIDFLKQAFVEIPELKIIAWTQYTPYFNDGDACIFSAHEPEFYLKEEFYQEPEDAYSEEGFMSWWGVVKDLEDSKPLTKGISKQRAEELDKKFKEYGNLLNSIPSQVLLHILGDHKRIQVEENKMTIEDYDHD